MGWVNSPLRRYLATLIALALGFVLLNIALASFGYRPSSLALLAMTLGVLGVSFWVSGRYWRSIDEVAREAQKSAWFWGGSIGGGVAFLGLMSNPFGVLDRIIPIDADRETVLAYGAAIGMVGQLIGFALAWAYWWARRR